MKTILVVEGEFQTRRVEDHMADHYLKLSCNDLLTERHKSSGMALVLDLAAMTFEVYDLKWSPEPTITRIGDNANDSQS
jgi:hypothetical protein